MRVGLDAHGYMRLPLPLRDQVDAWLADVGLLKHNVAEVVVGEGVVHARVLLRNEDGRHYVDRTTGEAACTWVEMPAARLPPAEAFGL